MTQANTENHEIARCFVADGSWRVDARLGLVYGKKGNAFRRLNSWGYVQIKFRDPIDYHTERSVLAHRVVWESQHGPLDVGLTINHINGNKQDNRLDNLEAISQAANVRHAFATGLNRGRPGMESARARLTDDQVRAIYLRAWQGELQADIGADYGVAREIVSNIKRGWAWTHITEHDRAA